MLEMEAIEHDPAIGKYSMPFWMKYALPLRMVLVGAALALLAVLEVSALFPDFVDHWTIVAYLVCIGFSIGACLTILVFAQK